MRKIVALFGCLFFTALAWGQNGYSTSWQFGVIDGASYCTGTTNCWYALGTTVLSPTRGGSVGGDGYMLWVKGDGSLWQFDSSNQGWNQVTMQYPNTHEIAISNQQTIYRTAASDPYCGSGPTYQVQQWNASSSSWGNVVGGNGSCLAHVAVGRADGTLMGVGYGNANGGPVYQFSNGAWAAFGTVQMLTLSVDEIGTMCGISRVSGTFKVYLQAKGDFYAMDVQPPTQPAGCTIAASDGLTALYVWDFAGHVYSFDFTNSVWNTVVVPNVGGAYVTAVLTNGKAQTYMTMSGGTGGGEVYHWNVYPGYVQGTISGTFSTCPGLGSCGGAVHTVKIQVQFPHGSGGALASQAGPPTNFLSATGYDFSFSCDPFTDPNNPECTPTSPIDGGFCSIVGALGGGIPLPTNAHFSEDVESYNGTYHTNFIVGAGNHWLANISCDATTNKCFPGTQAACGPPTITPAPIKVDGICFGAPCQSTDAVAVAREKCIEHSALIGGAWGEFYVYYPGLAKQTCTRVTFYRVNVGSPCF